jgi:hypothetical protein
MEEGISFQLYGSGESIASWQMEGIQKELCLHSFHFPPHYVLRLLQLWMRPCLRVAEQISPGPGPMQEPAKRSIPAPGSGNDDYVQLFGYPPSFIEYSAGLYVRQLI